MIITSHFFEAEFPFMYADINLVARVDKNTGKQWLVMQKIDSNSKSILFEEKIECIHTAVLTIPVPEFEGRSSNDEIYEETLKIRSTEYLSEVNLNKEEKFFALKSWIEGIAQIGFNSISIQTEIEKYNKLLMPISHRLFRFVALAHPEIIEDYLIFTEKQSMYGGKRHDSSFNLNIIQILHFLIVEAHELKKKGNELYKIYRINLEDLFYYHKDFDLIFSAIIGMNPSAKVFLDSKKFIPLLKYPKVKKLSNWIEISEQYSIMYNKKRYWVYWDSDFGWSLNLLNIDLQYSDTLENDLAKLTFLETLNFSGNNSFEYVNAEKLPKELKMITIARNNLKFISNLHKLNKLDYLNLFYNKISDIGWLQKNINLKILQLGHNKIENLKPINNLTKLEHLNLRSNEIRDVTYLQNLKNLEILNLTKNNISEIKGFEKLSKLRILNVGQNKLNDISYFSKLTQLETLDLSNNGIIDIKPLKFLKNLKFLKLNNNKIEDITPLKKLTHLIQLHMVGNMVSQEEIQKIVRKR